jgi:hypothetical protein
MIFHTPDHASLPSAFEEFLIADGATWRDQLTINVTEIQKQFHEQRAHLQQEEIPSTIRLPSAHTHITRHRLIWGGIVALLTCLIAISFSTIPMHTPSLRSSPPPLPQEIIENPLAAIGSMSPQDAFTKSVTLLPCNGVAARTLSITWLAASFDYGVAYILADCTNLLKDPRSVSALLPFGKTLSGEWKIMRGSIIPQSPNSRMAPFPDHSDQSAVYGPAYNVTVPVWLSLPGNGYLGALMPADAQQYHDALAYWVSQQYIFITGIFAQAPVRPSCAQSMTINNYPGWICQQNGLAFVTLLLSGNKTFFFAGNAPRDQIIEDAAQAQAHLSELFPH